MGELVIETLTGPPLEANSYFVADVAQGAAILIDAPAQITARVLHLLAETQTTLQTLICTHGHFDHILGVAEVAQTTGAQVACHLLEAEMLEHPSYGPFSFPYPLTPVMPALRLTDGDTVPVGAHHFTVLHTPGHSPGGICLYDAAAHLLFTGDMIFRGAWGRDDLPGGSTEQLVTSLQRLAALPAETRIYPGHGPTTTLGAERWLARIEEMR